MSSQGFASTAMHSAFETDRLFLRDPTVSDARKLYSRVTSDINVSLYLSWKPHVSEAETMAFLKKIVSGSIGPDSCTYLICEKGDKLPVGMLSLRRRLPEVLVGICLGKKWWAKGYATELVSNALVTVMQDDKVYRFAAHTDPENGASIKMLEKCGMLLEGRLRRFSIRPNLSSVPRDSMVFSAVK